MKTSDHLYKSLRSALIVMIAIPLLLYAQQGIVVLKNRNSATQADVTSFNALKVALYDSAGTGLTATTDPCDGVLATTVPISVTADTVLITAVAAKKNHICGGSIVVGAAEVINIVEGTGSTCGTSTAALLGSTTDANGASFAANGGQLIARPIFGIGTNVDTCLRVSTGGVRVSGYITYVQP